MKSPGSNAATGFLGCGSGQLFFGGRSHTLMLRDVGPCAGSGGCEPSGCQAGEGARGHFAVHEDHEEVVGSSVERLAVSEGPIEVGGFEADASQVKPEVFLAERAGCMVEDREEVGVSDRVCDTKRDCNVQAVDDVVGECSLEAAAWWFPPGVFIRLPAVEKRINGFLGVAAGDSICHAGEVAAGAEHFYREPWGREAQGHGHVCDNFADAPARAQ